MNKILITILLISSFVLTSCVDKPTNISGEVFIVTKDGQHIKLSGLTVRVIPANTMQKRIDEIQPAADKALENLVRTAKLCPREFSWEYCKNFADADLDTIPSIYFKDLPSPVAQAVTDSEGNYSLTIPEEGKYVIVSEGSRNVYNSTELYFWMVNIEAGGTAKQVSLSGDNDALSGSPDSAIKIDLSKYRKKNL